MPYALKIIETDSPDFPQPLKINSNSTHYPQIWTIGNLEILKNKLLGFFCSVKCPGNIILKTYDLVRSLRDAGITFISGFHSPIEKDVFDLLFTGSQPIVVCPARSIENMRIFKTWRTAIDNGRLLVLSPFEKKYKRVTAPLCEQRNRMFAMLAKEAFIPYAASGSRSENLCKDIIKAGKQIYTFEDETNRSLLSMGAKPIIIEDFKKQYQ